VNTLAGLPVLTAAEMRAAEDAAIAAGSSVAALMERAGAGVAEWTARLAGGSPILILCGPGNNGGDGYVAARLLRQGGADVAVAALSEPRTDAARAAAAQWTGPTSPLSEARPAPIVVDALFGTGVSRAVESAAAVAALVDEAQLAIAVDLPSGLDTDRGTPHGHVSECDITLALGALKPAHLLVPGATYCGDVRLVDLGLARDEPPGVRVLRRPSMEVPGAGVHKYSRGRVTVVGGAMPGASLLCATAALRAGAGYVSIDGGDAGGPAALVHRPFDAAALREQTGGAIVVGPGLGRDETARSRLAAALGTQAWLVVDGDALRLIDPDDLPWQCVLTPHSGEFDALFGTGDGSKIDRTRAAAALAGCVVVHKGADTVVAAPDGRVEVTPPGSGWLATAGSGDVLAGTIAARLAEVGAPFAAACDGVWMHGRAARMLGGGFIADDLPDALGVVRAMR
jgi:hydroxyethylthiazole kinase-like uncharacterized protein yjeF